MKKLFAGLLSVFSLTLIFASCVSTSSAASPASAPENVSPSPNLFYTGDGGKGRSIAILAPQTTGLAEDQSYIPALVQGELVSNFKRYSASKYENGFSASLPAKIKYQRNEFFTVFLLSTVITTDPLGSVYNRNSRKAGTYTWDGKKWQYEAKR
ncbi:MAG: hypothetical protein LBF77_07385 [Spirochaetaceae bacterium]|jgi:hypothetical protein|nr:hypothetical protein [Spirochaetaceae bacterium]